MQEQPIRLEKLDGQLLHALQIWPRVSWSGLGAILNIDPVTASRHWAHMQQTGVAWFAAYSQVVADARVETNSIQFVSAVIELQVRPKWLSRVFEELEHLGELAMVRATLGEWNISLDWRGESIDTLSDFINNRLTAIDGVRASRSFAVTNVPIEGSSWRYEGLNTEQQEQLHKLQRDDLHDPMPFTEYWHSIDSKLVDLIKEDARMSYTEMARRTDSVVGTVKRHLGHLLRNRDLVIRCDVARKYSSRPVTVRYFATVPAASPADIVAELSDFAEIRSCSVLIGKYNLMMNVWLESLMDAARFEAKLARRLPMVKIEERDLVTRYYVHGGRRITQNGRGSLDPHS